MLTNQEASPAAGLIGRAILTLVGPGSATTAGADSAESLARTVLAGLQRGTIDRSRFTDNGNFYFDQQALADYRTSLTPLGAIKSRAPDVDIPARRDDLSRVRGRVRQRGAREPVDVHRARRQDRTVPGRAGKLSGAHR